MGHEQKGGGPVKEGHPGGGESLLVLPHSGEGYTGRDNTFPVAEGSLQPKEINEICAKGGKKNFSLEVFCSSECKFEVSRNWDSLENSKETKTS